MSKKIFKKPKKTKDGQEIRDVCNVVYEEYSEVEEQLDEPPKH